MPPITVRPPVTKTWQAMQITCDTNTGRFRDSQLDIITWLYDQGGSFQYEGGALFVHDDGSDSFVPVQTGGWILSDGEGITRVLEYEEFVEEGWQPEEQQEAS